MDNILLTVQSYSPIFGVEYQVLIQTALHNHNVPCAVCHVSTRAAVLMIPAWRHCPSQWTLEYTGYLMTEYITQQHTSVLIKMQSLFLVAMLTQMEVFYTMLKQAAMGCPVHHNMIHRRSSPVLCALSKLTSCVSD